MQILNLNPASTTLRISDNDSDGVVALCNTTNAAFSVSFPAAKRPQVQELIFVNIGTNTLTLSTLGSDTIGISGATSATVTTGGYKRYVNDRSGKWLLIGSS